MFTLFTNSGFSFFPPNGEEGAIYRFIDALAMRTLWAFVGRSCFLEFSRKKLIRGHTCLPVAVS
ncbi:MAG: hypothetical protein FDX18_02880, partial [Chlorobium sp.]